MLERERARCCRSSHQKTDRSGRSKLRAKAVARNNLQQFATIKHGSHPPCDVIGDVSPASGVPARLNLDRAGIYRSGRARCVANRAIGGRQSSWPSCARYIRVFPNLCAARPKEFDFQLPKQWPTAIVTRVKRNLEVQQKLAQIVKIAQNSLCIHPRFRVIMYHHSICSTLSAPVHQRSHDHANSNCYRV